MVIDTSAIVAILFGEPDRRRFEDAIEAAPIRMISAVTRVELTFVIEGRKGDAGRERLERFLRLMDADIVSVTQVHADIAMDAFRRFGRGRHLAALNIGDSFSYALAAATGYPLLFKGNDFAHTDLPAALPPGPA
jgi:ribonuclease VapC